MLSIAWKCFMAAELRPWKAIGRKITWAGYFWDSYLGGRAQRNMAAMVGLMGDVILHLNVLIKEDNIMHLPFASSLGDQSSQYQEWHSWEAASTHT